MGRFLRVVSTMGLAAAVLWVGCSYDPVPQARIDDLPEESGEPSELHRPGQACVLCHSEYEGAEPALAVGGTIFDQNPESRALEPVAGVFVTVVDAAGASQKACTNAAGNFYVRLEDWPDAAFPLTVQVGNRFMRSLVGRERSCATCHVLPSEARSGDPTIDPITGAGRNSAGAILVERDAIPLDQRCAGAAEPTAAAGGFAAGGSSAVGGSAAGGSAAAGGASTGGGAAGGGGASGGGGAGGGS